jgi:hypothetical protein
MKSLVKNIREYFNRRTKATDAYKEANVEKRTLVIQNGEVASRLMLNTDFALMFNLYRFNMLERLEEADTDEKRIGNAYYVAGVRDFIDFVEKAEYLARVANKKAEL